MDRDPSRGAAATRQRVGRIVVRGEFGPLLSAAPQSERHRGDDASPLNEDVDG
jgi:hypothetical protein